MHLPLNLAIVLDNVGGNDPEVQMTVSIWIAKAIHIINLVI